MSTEIVVKESDLQELLEEVRKDLSTLFKNEKSDLAKAEPEEDKEKESPAAEVAPKEEMPKDAPADAAPPAAAADPVDDSALTAPDEVSPEASADAAPEALPETESPAEEAAEAADPAAEAAPSIEALQAEYEKLPEHELMMHLCAAHAACLARGGMVIEPAAEAQKEHEALGEPPPTLMSGAPAEPAAKGEVSMKAKEHGSDGSGDHGAKAGKGLKKSEADLKVEELTSKIADQEKALIELVNFVTTPVRKSVKNISDLQYLDRTEKEKKVYTKAQVHDLLKEKTKNPDLKKSDRELINRYYDGNVPVEQLEHLLKD